jgi:hypothetical protein
MRLLNYLSGSQPGLFGGDGVENLSQKWVKQWQRGKSNWNIRYSCCLVGDIPILFTVIQLIVGDNNSGFDF